MEVLEEVSALKLGSKETFRSICWAQSPRGSLGPEIGPLVSLQNLSEVEQIILRAQKPVPTSLRRAQDSPFSEAPEIRAAKDSNPPSSAAASAPQPLPKPPPEPVEPAQANSSSEESDLGDEGMCMRCWSFRGV